ncbi:MAG: hypothetical protein ACFFDF_14145 [Candidatus Odinarchaeota archaeon]
MIVMIVDFIIDVIKEKELIEMAWELTEWMKVVYKAMEGMK